MKKITKAAIGTAALGTAFVTSGEVLYQMFLKGKAVRESKRLHENSWFSQMLVESPVMAQGAVWIKTAARKDHTIIGRRGKWIHAEEYTGCDSHVWVIACHGYSVNVESIAAMIRVFHEQGWNVLAPHLTGHGISEDKAASMGWHDRLDLCDWIARIVKKDPQAQIVLYGVSMGASTVMMTTGEPMPRQVKCCVADCGYTSVYDEFKTQLRQWLHLPAFPFLYAGDFVTRLHAGLLPRRRARGIRPGRSRGIRARGAGLHSSLHPGGRRRRPIKDNKKAAADGSWFPLRLFSFFCVSLPARAAS